MRSNIRARFDCSDAESLMFSFRRMLRGVCDGEVLLDSTFRIHSVSDCLKLGPVGLWDIFAFPLLGIRCA